MGSQRVHQSRSVEFERLLFERQLESSVDGILAVGPGGEVLWNNRRFVELWGLPPGVVEARSDEELVRAISDQLVDPAGFLVSVQSLYEHPDRVSRDEVTLRDGRVFDRYSAPLTSPENAVLGRVWFYRDITQRKRDEEALRASNDRLQELNRMKNQFVNTAAHELATPVTPISLQVDLLKHEVLGPLNEKQGLALELIERNLARLTSLMKDILDAADVQSDKISLGLAAVDLLDVLGPTVEAARAHADQETVKLHLETGPGLRVQGDPQRLRQVLAVLVDNAIKFTPPGGRVTVRSHLKGDEVVTQVEDTGIGLRPEDFRKIFQPFSQVHDTMQRTRAGRGLGLVIAQGLVEMHGGRMWCDSPGPGKGATFSFALPRDAHVTQPVGTVGLTQPRTKGVWPFIHFRCPVCESRDINMRIIKNKYECSACKHTWR